MRHVSGFSVRFDSNLDGKGYHGANLSNYRVNNSNQKFIGDIEKGVKVQGGKV